MGNDKRTIPPPTIHIQHCENNRNAVAAESSKMPRSFAAVGDLNMEPIKGQFLTIEVPRVECLPATDPHHYDVVGVADYLLTKLLRDEAGWLHADFRENGGEWRVRSWSRDVSSPEEIVAMTERKSLFRAVLARFGMHYMGGQLYGGFAELGLTQCGNTHVAAIYMANDGWRGYWLRVFSLSVRV